ncbi:MAG: DUF1501 domain-containing protein [Pirellulales bacterium]
MTRRDLLRIGGLGLAGMTLAELADWQAASAETGAARPKSFGRAKSIILIHLYGSPSQIEWVDTKPNAPLEIRGELGSIPSSLPGCDVCELLPTFGKVLDRTTVLRSMTHPYPLHGVAYALTGVPTLDLPAELNPNDPRNWPYFGSVVDYVEAQRQPAGEAPRRAVPANIALPFRFSSRRVGEVPRAGPYATFLGAEFDPVWTDYVGAATKGISKTLADKRFDDNDPYVGLSPDSHFYVPAATELQGDVTLDRLQRRKSLVEQLETARHDLAASSRGKQLDRYRRMTYELLESDKLRTALDLRKEQTAIRELYGHTLFGQSCLAARRLVEAGSRVVSVFWDEYGLAGSGWDTHYNHYERMKKELCPGLDQGWYGLITDLDQRGLLDDTLVVCTSEHGRTPKITTGQGGGRDHWSRVYSTLLAGGGTKRGCIVGASDKQGGDVLERPISPKDLLATMYHLLGIDHHLMIHDRLNRPLPLVEGDVITEALA